MPVIETKAALQHFLFLLKNKHQVARSIISKCFAFCMLNSEEKNVPTEAQLATCVKLTVLSIKIQFSVDICK